LDSTSHGRHPLHSLSILMLYGVLALLHLNT